MIVVVVNVVVNIMVDMVVDTLINILLEIVVMVLVMSVFAGKVGVKVVPVFLGFDVSDDDRGLVVVVLV